MSGNCKDCNCDDNVIYRRIERPEYIILGVENVRYYQHTIPLNEAADILPDPIYKTTDFLNLIEDNNIAGSAISIFNFPDNNIGIFGSKDVAVSYVASNQNIQDAASNIIGVHVNITNKNYGLPITTHPSLLHKRWSPYQTPYNSLEDPTWLLSFPLCGSDQKPTSPEDHSKFKLKGCGKWKLEWKLRVRPIINLQCHEDPCTICDYPIITDPEFDEVKEMIRFIKSLDSQHGSKSMGIAEMRIETGIYSNDRKTYDPVVWSDGVYPQITLNEKVLWMKSRPKELHHHLQRSRLDENIRQKDLEDLIVCEDKGWKTGTSENYGSGQNEYLYGPNKNDIIYRFGGQGAIPKKGNFTVGVNDVDSPVTFYMHYTDTYNKNNLFSYIQAFDTSNVSKVGEMEIVTEAYQNDVWVVTEINEYDITSIDITGEIASLTVASNTNNPFYTTDLSGGGYSSGSFIQYDNLETRHRMNIYNHVVIDIEQDTSFTNTGYNVRPYTALTEDFVVELEGFTHVDLDREKEVNIYLRVFPEHNDYGSSIVGPVNGTHAPGWDSPIPSDNGILAYPTTSGFWPWAPLSMDFRNKWEEARTVYYEPMLPLDLDRALVINGNSYSDLLFRRNFGLSHKTDGWDIMIESGWVSAVKISEDCC